MKWHKANTSNGQGLIIDDETGENIAVSYKEENAELIAAAPDLLLACKAAYISLIDDEHYQEFKTVIETLKRAINKAETHD